jgi:uncharacterized protein (DUF305 family)
MKNEYLYGVIGLLIGVVVTGGFYSTNSHWRGRSMSHTMPSGSMMHNSDMMGMEHQMDAMTASLTGKTEDEFDKEFLSQMIVHHVGAVDMAKMVLATSKRQELIKLANEIISAQEKEISQMKQWQKDWSLKN